MGVTLSSVYDYGNTAKQVGSGKMLRDESYVWEMADQTKNTCVIVFNEFVMMIGKRLYLINLDKKTRNSQFFNLNFAVLMPMK